MRASAYSTDQNPYPTPALMSVESFAQLHGLSLRIVRDCINGVSANYPALKAKRTKPGAGGRIYITAEDAAAWRAALPDA